jgi:hypothetical protein
MNTLVYNIYMYVSRFKIDLKYYISHNKDTLYFWIAFFTLFLVVALYARQTQSEIYKYWGEIDYV